MHSTRSLAKVIFFHTILIVMLAVGISGLICLTQQYMIFQRQIEQTRRSQTETRKALLKRRVDDILEYIDYKRRKIEAVAKGNLKTRVNLALAAARHLYDYWQSKTPGAATTASLIREFLRAQRFSDGQGYFFAFGLDGTAQMHPLRPGTEGSNILDVTDTDGRPVVRQMIDLVRRQNQGFYSYKWPRPDNDGRGCRKIVFIEYFRPLQWIVGAGIYFQDIEKQVQNEVLERIGQIRFGRNGYFFIGRWDGFTLLGPGAGSNMLEVTDANGVQIVKELIARAKEGGGFVSYVMPRFNGLRPLPKISYTRPVRDWQWYVGAGVYVDDIENSVRAAQAGLKRQMYRDAAKVLLLILVLLATSLLMARSTILRMLGSFDLFSELFRRATENDGRMEQSRLNYLEFHQLAQAINRVLEDRRKAEKARQESEKQYRQLVESANSVILKWDPAGRIIYINPYGLALFGYRKEELVGRSVLETIVPKKDSSGRNLEAIINDILSDPDRYSSHENENITRNGRRLWISWNNKGIFDQNGKLREILSIGHDLTEKKALEARLIQAQKMEAVGTLAGGIAHDFNNSLQAILGYIQLILTSKDISQSDFRKLKQVEKAAQKASQLTRQLLTFSRKSESHMQQLDLNRQIRETSLLLKRTISAMIEIRLRLSPDLPPVRADAVQIEQVLMNIGINARDAMPNGGRLVIATGIVFLDEQYCRLHPELEPGRYVKLTISDNGQGMDEETLKHIFEPFYSTKETGKGTGLGLATVYGIIKNHGGHITVRSKPGGGSVFNIFLPAAAEESPDQDDDSRLSFENLGGSETILMVDDEQNILDIGKTILSNAGYRVLCAGNGREAVEIFRRNRGKIDLVIMDLIMPEMNGNRCLELLREIDPEIRAIITSGYAPEAGLERRSEKAAAFLQKPYQMYELLEVVRKVLDQ